MREPVSATLRTPSHASGPKTGPGAERPGGRRRRERAAGVYRGPRRAARRPGQASGGRGGPWSEPSPCHQSDAVADRTRHRSPGRVGWSPVERAPGGDREPCERASATSAGSLKLNSLVVPRSVWCLSALTSIQRQVPPAPPRRGAGAVPVRSASEPERVSRARTATGARHCERHRHNAQRKRGRGRGLLRPGSQRREGRLDLAGQRACSWQQLRLELGVHRLAARARRRHVGLIELAQRDLVHRHLQLAHRRRERRRALARVHEHPLGKLAARRGDDAADRSHLALQEAQRLLRRAQHAQRLWLARRLGRRFRGRCRLRRGPIGGRIARAGGRLSCKPRRATLGFEPINLGAIVILEVDQLLLARGRHVGDRGRSRQAKAADGRRGKRVGINLDARIHRCPERELDVHRLVLQQNDRRRHCQVFEHLVLVDAHAEQVELRDGDLRALVVRLDERHKDRVLEALLQQLR
mmetsp:Transcript_8720/g.25823  ORF Transcript_8720/g.25823 Transcript_8720/m.25823 type:complete len:469 (-) Transcript_8720:73-1479(-)